MRRRVRPLALALLVAAVAACGGGDGPATAAWQGTVDTLPGGAVHVRNPVVPMLDSAAGWRLVEELRIGRAEGEGPDVFTDVRALAADGAGRIYVLQSQAKQVVAFDSAGRHLWTVGRQGAGPGEFEDPNGLAIDAAGRLWVADPRNVRFSVFDAAGGLAATHRRGIGSYGFMWNGTFLRDGRLVETGVSGAYGTALVRFDSAFAPRDTFLRTPPPVGGESNLFVFRQGTRTSYVEIPFRPSEGVTVVDPRGLVWTGDQGSYRLVARTLEGDTLRIVERAYEPVPVVDEDLAGFREMVRALGAYDASRIPSAKPAFSTLDVAPDGHLWVRLHRPHGEAGTLFDVFDPEGRYVTQVRAAAELARYPGVSLTAGALYGVVRDELDVPQVIRLRVVREGGRAGN